MLPIKNDGNWRVWPDVRLTRPAPFFGKVISLKTPLTYYRRHDKNDSSQMNIDFEKSLLNQIDHHEYLNQQLKELNIKQIPYKKSFKYFSFKVKTFLPTNFIRLIQNTKKKLK